MPGGSRTQLPPPPPPPPGRRTEDGSQDGAPSEPPPPPPELVRSDPPPMTAVPPSASSSSTQNDLDGPPPGITPPPPPLTNEGGNAAGALCSTQATGAGTLCVDNDEDAPNMPPPPPPNDTNASWNDTLPRSVASKKAAASAGIAAMLASAPMGALPGSRPAHIRPKGGPHHTSPPPPGPPAPAAAAAASASSSSSSAEPSSIDVGNDATVDEEMATASSESITAHDIQPPRGIKLPGLANPKPGSTNVAESGDRERHRAATMEASQSASPSAPTTDVVDRGLWIDSPPKQAPTHPQASSTASSAAVAAVSPPRFKIPSSPDAPAASEASSSDDAVVERPNRAPPPPPAEPAPLPPIADAAVPTPSASGDAAGFDTLYEFEVTVTKRPGQKLGLAFAGGAMREKANVHSHQFGSSDVRRSHYAPPSEGWVGIYVQSVVPGGPAEASGLFALGDHVVAVNDKSVRKTPHVDFIESIISTDGPIKFTVQRRRAAPEAPSSASSPSPLRDSSPSQDDSGASEGPARVDRMSAATRERLIALIGDDGDDDVVDSVADADSSDDEEGGGSRGGGSHKPPVLKAESLQVSPVYSTDDAKPYVGWMHKMGGGKKKWSSRKTWKRRFFRLQGSMLLYYKPESVLPDESGPIPGETAKGYINLQADMTVERPTERRLILVTPEREYPFVCTTALVADGWANAIRDSISTIITTVVRQQKAEMAAAKKK